MRAVSAPSSPTVTSTAREVPLREPFWTSPAMPGAPTPATPSTVRSRHRHDRVQHARRDTEALKADLIRHVISRLR